MTVALTLNARTQISLVLNTAGIAGGAASLDVQYGTTPNLEFCIAPLINVATGATITLPGLNRRQTYYVRARSVVGGVPEAWGAINGFTTQAGAEPAAPTGVLIQPALLMVPIALNQIVSPNVIAGYPAANLVVNSPAAALRCSGTANKFWFWVETSNQAIDTIVVLDTNFSEAATVRIFAGDNVAMVDGTGTPPSYSTSATQFRASASLPGRRGYHTILRLPASIEYRYIMVEVTEPNGLPGNLAHITHAAFGVGRIARNYSDMTDSGMDLSTTERMRDGTLDLVNGFRGRKIDLEVSAMLETQYETTFGDLSQAAGNSTPVFLLSNTRSSPYLHDRMAFGLLTAGRQTNSNMRFTRNFSMESIIN